VSSASSSVKKGPSEAAAAAGDSKPDAAPAEGAPVETEDTMKNLRKTFAGIFGDLQ
jgi:hypothetical protein